MKLGKRVLVILLSHLEGYLLEPLQGPFCSRTILVKDVHLLRIIVGCGVCKLSTLRYIGWSISSSKVSNPICPTETKFLWAGFARVVIVPISCCSAMVKGKQTSKFSSIRSTLLLFGTTHTPSPMIHERITCAAVFSWIVAM